MTSETSAVRVEYCQRGHLPQQHSLGFSITSTHITEQSADGSPDSGCYMEDREYFQQVNSNSSGSSDDERADVAKCNGASRPTAIHYKHVISHVDPSSPLNHYTK